MEERNWSIDFIKFFSILGVVCIHTAPFKGTYLGIVINTISRVCVPLFFMFSGYFFYSKSNKDYMIKFTKSLIKVLLLWIFVYILYNICLIILSNIINSKNLISGVVEYLIKFKISDIYYATGIVMYHLWYLSAMIIVIPILYLIIDKNILDKCVWYTLCLNIIGVLLPVLISESLWIKTRDAIFLGLFYCVLGAYINKYEVKIKEKILQINRFKYVSIIIFLFIISIVEKIIYLFMFGGSGDYFISTIPLSIFIFGICLRKRDIYKDTIISEIGKNTLGIYLIHPLIIRIISLAMYKFDIEYISQTSIWHVLYTPTILIVSYLIYSIIKNIKKSVLTKSTYKSELDVLNK